MMLLLSLIIEISYSSLEQNYSIFYCFIFMSQIKEEQSKLGGTITSPQRQLTVDPEVLQIYQKLNKQIDNLDIKVQLLIDKHEGEFIVAYQTHVRKIKQDLSMLKEKADRQQKEMNDNNRSMMLQKQAIIFRDQSLKLYERLQIKTQQAEFYKFRAKDLEKTVAIIQKQVRETMKSRKTIETKLSFAEKQLAAGRKELHEKNQQLRNIKNTASMQTAELGKKNEIERVENSEFKMAVTRTDFKKRTFSHSGLGQDFQLKGWFLECIKTVKKQIATRKINRDKNTNWVSVSYEEFKTIDKLRLLEKFVENQRLLTIMYEKIFPSRTNELKDYLSTRSIDVNTEIIEPTQQSILLSHHKDSQMILLMEDSERKQVILPKMNTPKRVNQVANKLSLREGKLRIVHQ